MSPQRPPAVSPRHAVELLLLGALWGASFLFMRVGAPEFGPIPLIGVRVAVAAAFLLLVLLARGQLPALVAHPRRRELFWLGVLNSALPFCLFAFAALGITAGLNAILNSTAPMWTALVAFVWLRQRPTAGGLLGLLLGIVGVVVLVSGRGGPGGMSGSLAAIAAGLLASLCYGLGVVYTKQRLASESPWLVAAATQCAATLVLAPLAIWLWPEQPISAAAWASVIALGIASTGLAYILYFQLILAIGPARAVTVTLLIPIFASLWGTLLLDEAVTPRMLLGGGIVLLGTALATGLLGSPRRAAAQSE
jgi:drug/metabolite transporter (DMT)-like permease